MRLEPRRLFSILICCSAFCLLSDKHSVQLVAQQVADNLDREWETLGKVLDECSATYSETWDDLNCRTLHSGAYLGNGDFGVHLGGTKNALVYYLGKNGFHAGNNPAGADGDGVWTQHILNLAVLTIETSSGSKSGSEYQVTQDLKDSEIRTLCTMGGARVNGRAFLAPEKNCLVIEFSTSSGQSVPLQVTLALLGNQYVAKRSGVEGQVAWVTKEPNATGAPFYVKGAVAARILGAEAELTTDSATWSRLKFALPADGSTVSLFVAAEHLKNLGSPLETVQAAAREATVAQTEALKAANRAWWKEYWLRAHIELGDDVQKYWYNHLYLIGSAARSGADNSPGKAPGHWGPWNRRDDMMWFSNISMNYNGQNPYYGMFAANHVDLIEPYIEAVKFYSENTGRRRVANRWVSPTIASKMPANCRGVAFELSFTSHGTSCGEGAWVDQDGSMPTNAVFGILPAVWKWKYGQDREYLAKTCYPMMRDVADFFDDYIGPPINGKYEVFGAVHEGRDWFAANDMFSLGCVKFLYREIIAASEELGVDADRREHWQAILDGIGPYRLQPWDDTITFRPDAVHDVMEALRYQGGARNTGIMFTTTFDNISRHSLPAYKIATCQTLDKGNMFYPQRFSGWQDSNDFGMMFVMAIRAGYPAERVIEAIKGWKPELNGIVSQKQGGGIETAGIVEAINNMLLQSHDGVIRLFPNWDRRKRAGFKRLRGVGAFLVDANFNPQQPRISQVRIVSEKGRRCTIENPFPGSSLLVVREADQQSVPAEQHEDEFSFETVAGEAYSIQSQPFPPPPAGLPLLTEHPRDVKALPPATATFSVTAQGEGLRYQWQKNRVDIPGATESSYTTPEVTLWDYGSEFRCVVSCDVGSIISRPGLLNAK